MNFKSMNFNLQKICNTFFASIIYKSKGKIYSDKNIGGISMDLDLFKKTSGTNKSRKARDFDEEFSVETSFEVHDEGSMTSYNQFADKGIRLYNYGDRIRLVYDGILVKSGAKDIFAVIGYGKNDKWEDTTQYQMHNTDGSIFELLMPEKNGRRMNIAFKDGADNWDNNS